MEQFLPGEPAHPVWEVTKGAGGGGGGNESFLCTGPLDPLVNPLGAREFPGG